MAVKMCYIPAYITLLMEYLPLFNLSLIVVNADLSLGKGDIITERAVSREDNKPSHLNQANAVYSVAEQNLFFGGSPAVTKIAPPPPTIVM